MTAKNQIVCLKNYKLGLNSRGLPSQYHSVPVLCGVLTNPVFQKACKVAGVQPTTRQASKFRNGHGAAHAALKVFGAEGLKAEVGGDSE